MNEFVKGAPADFVIKAKDQATGKYTIVGRAWKKSGPYGNFISIIMGPKENRQSYLMVKPPEPRPPDAVRADPAKQMPEKYTLPPKPIMSDDFDL